MNFSKCKTLLFIVFPLVATCKSSAQFIAGPTLYQFFTDASAGPGVEVVSDNNVGQWFSNPFSGDLSHSHAQNGVLFGDSTADGTGVFSEQNGTFTLTGSTLATRDAQNSTAGALADSIVQFTFTVALSGTLFITSTPNGPASVPYGTSAGNFNWIKESGGGPYLYYATSSDPTAASLSLLANHSYTARLTAGSGGGGVLPDSGPGTNTFSGSFVPVPEPITILAMTPFVLFLRKRRANI